MRETFGSLVSVPTYRRGVNKSDTVHKHILYVIW